MRLSGVADKTRLLASHYAANDGLATADDLRRQIAMRQQLHALAIVNETHLQDARGRADVARAALGHAERKRSRMETERRGLERSADLRSSTAPE